MSPTFSIPQQHRRWRDSTRTMSHATQVNASRHTYECVRSRIWMRVCYILLVPERGRRWQDPTRTDPWELTSSSQVLQKEGVRGAIYMCVYVHIYIHIYIYIHMYTHVNIYIHTWWYTHVRTYVYSCTSAQIHNIYDTRYNVIHFCTCTCNWTKYRLICTPAINSCNSKKI